MQDTADQLCLIAVTFQRQFTHLLQCCVILSLFFSWELSVKLMSEFAKKKFQSFKNTLDHFHYCKRNFWTCMQKFADMLGVFQVKLWSVAEKYKKKTSLYIPDQAFGFGRFLIGYFDYRILDASSGKNFKCIFAMGPSILRWRVSHNLECLVSEEPWQLIIIFLLGDQNNQ